MLKTFFILFAFGSLILSESATLTESEKAELLKDPEKIDTLIEETNDKIKEANAALLNVNREIEIKNDKELLFHKAIMENFLRQTVNYAPINTRNNDWRLAKYIRNEFRKTFRPHNWLCIVGRQIAYDFKTNAKLHILASVGDKDILLFN